MASIFLKNTIFKKNTNQGFQYNESISLWELNNRTYGLNGRFLKYGKYIFEKTNIYELSDWDTIPRTGLLKKKIRLFYGRKFFKKTTINIFFLDFIQSYKGWRHSKGFPCRGQRTWSNASSAKNANISLRKFKLKLLTRLYKKFPEHQLNVLYLAEQINMLWRSQWNNEWKAARKQRLEETAKGKKIEPDLIAMSKGNVVHPNKVKRMNKRQKQQLKKNSYSLGFEIGFTTDFLKKLVRENNEHKLSSFFVKKNVLLKKKKKKDLKAKIMKHRQKKKSKKSVWD